MTITFMYNGKARVVEVQKETKTFIQGRNCHAGAKTTHATYSLDKMKDIIELPRLQLTVDGD